MTVCCRENYSIDVHRICNKHINNWIIMMYGKDFENQRKKLPKSPLLFETNYHILTKLLTFGVVSMIVSFNY